MPVALLIRTGLQAGARFWLLRHTYLPTIGFSGMMQYVLPALPFFFYNAGSVTFSSFIDVASIVMIEHSEGFSFSNHKVEFLSQASFVPM
jgi:hypothetical protein